MLDKQQGVSTKFVFDHAKALKKWQDRFCDMAGVFACCLGNKGDRITDFSGNTSELETVLKYVTDIRIHNIFIRVTESQLEDQAVEITDIPNLKLAAVAIKNGQALAGVWIICAVLQDAEYDHDFYHLDPITDFHYQTTENKFYKSLDLLRVSMLALIQVEDLRNEEVQKNASSQLSIKEMEDAFHRAEVTAEIVSLLDSDEDINSIMLQIITKVASFLEISNAFVVSVNNDNNFMDVVVQWNEIGSRPVFDRKEDLERCWFMNSNKTFAVSATTAMSAGEREQLDNMGIKAVIAMPVLVGQVIGFYVCLSENRNAKNWTIDEIKFINDAIRILQSIIVKRIQKNSLASSFQSLESILDNVGSSIYVRDMKTNLLLFANRSLRNYFAKELQEGTLEDLFEGNVPARSHSGMYEIHHEQRNRWYDLYYTHINWVDGRLVSLCAIYDITEKKLYQKRIEQQAYTDFLTGLYNRMCCERDLAKYIDEAQQKGAKGALLYLDLDDFKHINDSLGHQYGDVLLQNVASSLTSIAGISDSCYRMGGDEFVVIVPPDSYYRMDNILNEIRNVFSTPWYLKDDDYYCTMSMGIVEFPDNGESVSELIKRSDIVMYEAKKGGKNRIARYSDSIGASSTRRLDLEKGLKDGTYNNFKEFDVYYQPIMRVNGKKSECIGAEALLRWTNEKLGSVSPAEFIPLADYMGLIAPLGDFVMQRACENCRRWNKASGGNMFVTVNLTASQLMQTDVLDMIRRSIEENNIRPENLKLEITESLAINDLERTEKTMLAIKDMGVGLVMDDFGEGYSSLNSIQVLPFEMVKISQKFVYNLEEDGYAKAFVCAVRDVSAALDTKIVVEGIETQSQLDILSKNGIELIQGFYFDKALPEADFADKYIKSGSAKPKKKKIKD